MTAGMSGLLEAYRAQRDSGRPLVLATIVAAQGSTYRKPGARMLIDADGKCFGLLGGGCFEGDLVERAREVLADGRTRAIDYDMRGADDDLWGLGLGCNGAVRVLLQRLAAGNDFQPLAALVDAADRRQVCVVATVIDCGVAGDQLGASIVISDGIDASYEHPPALPGAILRHARTSLRERRPRLLTHPAEDGSITVFYDFVPPPPHILILGAGVDAEPVVRLAKALGWNVTVADHRSVRARFFPDADAFVTATPESLDASIGRGDYAAAVVMSHKLEQDRLYLMALARSNIPYIGLLGPAGRREALLGSLGKDARRLERRSYGPVGLDLGAETPEEIALSIISGIQAFLQGRSGGVLASPGGHSVLPHAHAKRQAQPT